MKQAKTLKPDELQLVLAHVAVGRHPARNRAIVLTSFLTGMRAHELASLKLSDVMRADGRIRSEFTLSAEQTKGHHARRVFVNSALQRELAHYIRLVRCDCHPSEPLFASQKAGAFSANTMCQLFLNIYKDCGIKGASSHSGRRTFITNLASKSVSVRVLAILAGHSSIATTQRYIDVNDQQLRNAVELA